MRVGRLNMIEIKDIIVKTCIVREKTRPYKLQIEAWALDHASRMGINSPKVLNYYRNGSGQEVLVLEKIPGNHLDSSIQPNLMMYRKLGEQLSRRFNLNCGFGWIDPETKHGLYNTWISFLLDFVQQYGGQLCKHGIISNQNLEYIKLIISDVIPSAIYFSTIVHRDLKPQNIIYSRSRVFLIDWENVILGDPAFDFALFKARFGGGLRHKYLSKYSEINQITELIYEIVALIGWIDFCITYRYGINGKTKKLQKLLSNLRSIN